MRKALLLAQRAEGKTRPNPMVGALAVKGSRIVGTGYHRRAGEPHAEVVALSEARGWARGATLYITMEPCCHWGRTGPCTEAILAAGIKRVVIGSIDPNPLVSGKGVRELRRTGVKVTMNVLAEEAKKLNEAYYTFMRTGRPFVTMKAALSMDGRIATGRGESHWITGDKARAFVHLLRRRADAVMVGIGTVLADDPQLSVRHGKEVDDEVNPLKVILDSRLRISEDAQVLRHESWKTIVATTNRAPERKIEKLCSMGVQVLTLFSRNGRVNIRALLTELGKRNVQNLLIEGGARVFASFMGDHLVNKAFIFLAPVFLGEGIPLFRGWEARKLKDAPVLTDMKVSRLGRDILCEGYLKQ